MAVQASGSSDVTDLLAKVGQAHSRALDEVAGKYKGIVARLEAEVSNLHAQLRDGKAVHPKEIDLNLNEEEEAQAQRSQEHHHNADNNVKVVASNGTTGSTTAANVTVVPTSSLASLPPLQENETMDATETETPKPSISKIWKMARSQTLRNLKVQVNDDSSVCDIDGDDDVRVSRKQINIFTSENPIPVTWMAMNDQLRLRSQWTKHPEEENTELLLLQAGALREDGSEEELGEKADRSRGSQSRELDNCSKFICGLLNVKVQNFSDLIAPPGANWRLCWDLFGAILIGYDTVMIPFTLSFEPKENAFFVAMNWFTMLFWTFDMVFTFFVGFIHNGVTVMDPKRIAQRYFMTWFFLDLLVIASDWFNNVGEATSPDDSEGSNVSGLGKLVRSLRVIRVLRLLRLLKLKRMMADFQDHISSEYTYLLLSLVKLLFFILFLNHGIACLWYWIGRHAYENSQPSWVEANEMQGQELGYKYTTSLHWTLTQFTPASMEVFPQNTAERTMSVIVLMFALVAFSSFVGSISTSMTALRNMNANINKQFWMLRRFLKQQSIPKQVSRRIVKYLEYVVEKKHGKVQQANITIIQMLSEQLREELTFELTFPNIQSQLFFTYLISYPLMDVVVRKICNLALRNKLIACDDHVFYPGDEATHVYCFLGPGHMEYLFEDSQPINPPVKEKEWVAEPAFWSAWRHVGRFKALTECEFLCIDATQFARECCKTVTSWRLASQYGDQYLETVKGHMLSDIIRDESIEKQMKEWIQEERDEHYDSMNVKVKEKSKYLTSQGLAAIRRTLDSARGATAEFEKQKKDRERSASD